LLFAPGAASFAAGPKATPIPEIHRVADIFQPLSRPAELFLESTHLVFSICCGIFLVVMAVLAYFLVCQHSRKPPRLALRFVIPSSRVTCLSLVDKNLHQPLLLLNGFPNHHPPKT
jgi:hypothetical protein